MLNTYVAFFLLQKNKAGNLCKEAVKLEVRYAQAQKRIDSLVKKLKVIKLKQRKQEWEVGTWFGFKHQYYRVIIFNLKNRF